MSVNNSSETKEKSKQRIIKAATRLFAQKGYDGVSIRKICREANANICMISYFWNGKEGLYQGILDDLIERQTEYARSFIDLDEELSLLSKTDLLERLELVLDKAVEMLYGGFISRELISFLIQEQNQHRIKLTSPLLEYVRKIIAAVLNKDVQDKEVIFKTLFIVSQINSPLILTALSLDLLKQKDFVPEDKNIILSNVKTYVQTLFKKEA
ncbi:CerR family C-terminal domain-containing protein [uncultured Succinivibrio sp.]|uniref:TetR/AcrR family transcriptional regulator n=1 Tax=uncultured Succinivibrio sp. TaxID=540749 RepID=UPI0025D7F303|nr:CerR family C-terminal domain-containing protein [uncultured Succinivibrio sp.]